MTVTFPFSSVTCGLRVAAIRRFVAERSWFVAAAPPPALLVRARHISLPASELHLLVVPGVCWKNKK